MSQNEVLPLVLNNHLPGRVRANLGDINRYLQDNPDKKLVARSDLIMSWDDVVYEVEQMAEADKIKDKIIKKLRETLLGISADSSILEEVVLEVQTQDLVKKINKSAEDALKFASEKLKEIK